MNFEDNCEVVFWSWEYLEKLVSIIEVCVFLIMVFSLGKVCFNLIGFGGGVGMVMIFVYIYLNKVVINFSFCGYRSKVFLFLFIFF